MTLTPRIPGLDDMVAKMRRDIEWLKRRPAGGGGGSGSPGPEGPAGPAGPGGRGITGAVVNSSGDLVLTYSDGATVNVGHVVGAAGQPGTAPTQPLITVALLPSTTAASGGVDLAWPAPTENVGGWSLASGGVRLVVPTAGLYTLVMQAVWNSPSTVGAIGALGCYVCCNGNMAGAYGRASNERSSAPDQTVMQATGVARLVAGDYLLGRVYTSTATTLRGAANPNSYGGTYLTAYRIAD